MINLTSIIALLQLALSLLARPNMTPSMRATAVQIANQAVALATQALALEAASAVSLSQTPTTTASMIPQDGSLPPEIPINPQTIVGVLCYYDVTYTNQNTGVTVPASGQDEARGSGVIINSHGNILTNRHLIEQPTSFASIMDGNGNSIPIAVNERLNRCEVGQLPVGSLLPTADQILSLNPFVQIPVLGYTAQPIYVASTLGLSAAEIQRADFAILQITGVSQNGPTFGVTSVPSSFPYVKLLPVKQYPQLSGLVITYGFPGDVTVGQHNTFETLTMTGSVGHVTGIEIGDSFYADTPITIRTDMEISHGRSGSPLFWRGYDIGIVTYFIGDNRTDSASVASDAILKDLQFTGYIPSN